MLKKYYPAIKSTRDFIFGKEYLGEIKIDIITKDEPPSVSILFDACMNVLSKISFSIPTVKLIDDNNYKI